MARVFAKASLGKFVFFYIFLYKIKQPFHWGIGKVVNKVKGYASKPSAEATMRIRDFVMLILTSKTFVFK